MDGLGIQNWIGIMSGLVPSEKMTSYKSPGKTKDLVAIVIHEIIRFCNSKWSTYEV